MTKDKLLDFWVECRDDPKRRVMFHTEFKKWLDEQPDTPSEAHPAPESDKTDKPDRQRTPRQNDALHAWCDECAQVCLNQGLDVAAILEKFPRLEMPMDGKLFKRMFIHPVIKVRYGKTSTAQLKKDEIDPAIEPAIRAFGEKGIELPRFGDDEQTIQNMKGVRLHQTDQRPDYPEYKEPLV